jgi:hypothetical protein
MHERSIGNRSMKMWATSVIEKMPKVKNHPMGKNSVNLVNLGPMLWFFKYFFRKNQRKKWRFCLKTKPNFEKVDHNIGFGEKRRFFRRKLAKIAENCDHNIDPWSLSDSYETTNAHVHTQVQNLLRYLPIYVRKMMLLSNSNNLILTGFWDQCYSTTMFLLKNRLWVKMCNGTRNHYQNKKKENIPV